jgi:hypothetical protein
MLSNRCRRFLLFFYGARRVTDCRMLFGLLMFMITCFFWAMTMPIDKLLFLSAVAISLGNLLRKYCTLTLSSGGYPP